MNFPELQELLAHVPSESEREFLEFEFAPGLQYYQDRLDQIMFSGDTVLDAGCGAGQWSIAMSQRFRKVMALDLKPERLDLFRKIAAGMQIRNVQICRGSVERLPYADGCCDAVFCYGVIMFTDVQRTLSEYFRVLRPGGRVYLCLNADGWSRYLIEERGKEDQSVRRAGQTTLYNSFWRRAIQMGVVDELRWAAAPVRKIEARIGHRPFRRPSLFISHPLRRSLASSVAKWMLYQKIGSNLLGSVRSHCGEELMKLLLSDAWAIANGAPGPTRLMSAEAFLPEEFEALAGKAGFEDFQWAPEGQLVCDWLRPAVKPKYAGHFGNELAVWECVFKKPDVARPKVSLERHFKAALEARDTNLYPGGSDPVVLSNGSRWTYPRPLFEYARELGNRLGGQTYMMELARAITEGARDEEEAARMLILFVQRAVFRDPVSQPIAEDGAIPDGLTTLLCARGRCGHVSQLLVELFGHAGMEARLRQFPRHVVAEVRLGERWAIADGDAFKNGIIPVNPKGRILTMDEILDNPYQLDRFPPTGWFMRPGSRFTLGMLGNRVTGYVDALDPDKRGFTSGYYVPSAQGYPPSLPSIVGLQAQHGRFLLEWTPSSVREGRLCGYRVTVGTQSRGWSYDYPGDRDEILRSPASDVLCLETTDTRVEGSIPPGTTTIFASVTAFSSRIEKEPATFFWPSEEKALEIHP